LQACRLSQDLLALGIFGVEVWLGWEGPAEGGEAFHHEAVEAGKGGLGRPCWEDNRVVVIIGSWECGLGLEVGAAPGVDHANEDGEGEFSGWVVGGVFGEVLDCGDDGVEGGLVGWCCISIVG